MLELYKWFQEERGRRSMLAAMVGVAPSAISHWQRLGRVPFPYIKQISKITGIPVAALCPELFEDEENGD